MKRRGGKTGIDPIVTARGLWLETHSLPTVSEKMHGDEDPTSIDAGSGQRNRRLNKHGSNCETKPIENTRQ
jgi:hypothetical protein